MMNDELYPHLVEIFPSVICPKSMDFNSQLVLDKFMKKKWKIDDTSNFDFIRYRMSTIIYKCNKPSWTRNIGDTRWTLDIIMYQTKWRKIIWNIYLERYAMMLCKFTTFTMQILNIDICKWKEINLRHLCQSHIWFILEVVVEISP